MLTPRRALPSLFGALVVAGVVLVGCTPTPAAAPTPTAAGPSSSASAAPAEPAVIALDLSSDAEANKPFFDQTMTAYLATGGPTDGRALVDALVAAGFPKDAMEVTPDRTPIGDPVDTIQFAVRLNGTCLVGQFGSASGFGSTSAAMTGEGRCLIGTTRPIDW